MAQLDIYAGMVFATWDQEAPSLEEYLGDARFYLDMQFNRRDNGATLIGPEKWIMLSNWKMPVDNFCGDEYHLLITHRAAQSAMLKAKGRRFDATSYFEENGGYTVNVGNGHGIITSWPENEEKAKRMSQNFVPDPRLGQYRQEIMPELERRIGSRASRMGLLVGSIFPNLSVHPGTAIRLLNPRGPLKTEIWTFHLTENDAPEDIHRINRRNAQLTFGISGILEQDDMDNFNQCTQAGLSPMARRSLQYLAMGIGHETTHPAFPGSVGGAHVNEGTQRGLYTRWQEFMNAKSWKEISIAPQTAKYEGTATFKG